MTLGLHPSGASPEQVVLEPLLDHLSTLVKAVNLYAAHLDPVARGSHAEELALMSAPSRVAGYYSVALCYLI